MGVPPQAKDVYWIVCFGSLVLFGSVHQLGIVGGPGSQIEVGSI